MPIVDRLCGGCERHQQQLALGVGEFLQGPLETGLSKTYSFHTQRRTDARAYEKVAVVFPGQVAAPERFP